MEKTNETPFAIDSQMVMRFRCYFNFEITSTHQQKYSSYFTRFTLRYVKLDIKTDG